MKALPNGAVTVSDPPYNVGYHYEGYRDSATSVELRHSSVFEHYAFFVRELHRLTVPGRVTAVHCTDIHYRQVQA